MVDVKLDTENDLEWVENTVPIFSEITSEEKITNGKFDTDSDWLIYELGSDPSSISGGRAIVGDAIYQSISVTENSKLVVSFSISGIPDPRRAVLFIFEGIGLLGSILVGNSCDNGNHVVEIEVAHGTDITIAFNRNVIDFTYQLDDVSLREYSSFTTESDIDYDYSDFVNVVDLLEAKKGEIRQFPMAGADIKSFQMSRYDQQKMDSIIKETLILDKWKPNSVIVNAKDRENLEVTINPKRND